MNTIEQLKARYEKTKENDDLVEIRTNTWGFRNANEREKLREEYISLLPKNKQLAIWLHSKLCHWNHTDGCGWYYAVHDLEDDWNDFSHKEYLEKANKALEVCSDDKLIMKLVEALK